MRLGRFLIVATVVGISILAGGSSAFAQVNADDFILEARELPSGWELVDVEEWRRDELVGSEIVFSNESYQQRLLDAGFDSAASQSFATPEGERTYGVVLFSRDEGIQEMIEIAGEEGYGRAGSFCGGDAYERRVGDFRSFFTVHGTVSYVLETYVPGDVADDPLISVLCDVMEEAADQTAAATGDGATTTTVGSAASSSDDGGLGAAGPIVAAVAAVILAAWASGAFGAGAAAVGAGAASAGSGFGATAMSTGPGASVVMAEPTTSLVLDETFQDIDLSESEVDGESEREPEEERDEESPVSVVVTADAARVGPGEQVGLTASVSHDDGTPAAGRSVTFEAVSGGSLTPPAGTSGPDGAVHTTYLPSGGTRGEMVIRARCGGSSGTTRVTVEGDEPAELELAAEPRRLRADGRATARLTAEVYTAELKPAVGVTVRFSDDGGGRIEGAVAVTGDDGVARATYTMPEETGLERITISAEAEAATPRPELTQHRSIGVIRLSLEATADPERVAPGSGDRAWVSATLTDDDGAVIEGHRLVVKVEEGDGRIYPESALTRADGTIEVGYQPGQEMGHVTIKVSHEKAEGVEATVGIDQSAPFYESDDGSGPTIRVLLAERKAEANLGIEVEDVVGVQVLDAAGNAWPADAPPDAFLVAAFLAEHGVKDSDYYREAAEGLRRRAGDAQRAEARLLELAARGAERIDRAEWWQAVKTNYYDPAAELALAILTLHGLWVATTAAAGTAAVALGAKMAALTPAKAVGAATLLKIKASAAAAGIAEYVGWDTIRDEVIGRLGGWLERQLGTDWEQLANQEGLLLTQASILGQIGMVAGGIAQAWEQLDHTGGPASAVRDVLAFGGSTAHKLQQLDEEFLRSERERLSLFGATDTVLAAFDEDHQRVIEGREESRRRVAHFERFGRMLEDMWRQAQSQRVEGQL